jgi:hypothetical protein
VFHSSLLDHNREESFMKLRETTAIANYTILTTKLCWAPHGIGTSMSCMGLKYFTTIASENFSQHQSNYYRAEKKLTSHSPSLSKFTTFTQQTTSDISTNNAEKKWKQHTLSGFRSQFDSHQQQRLFHFLASSTRCI